MAELTLVDPVSRADVERIAARHHALWGGGRTREEHVAHNLEQLERASPDVLRYIALARDGEIVASMKRYQLWLARGERRFLTMGVGAVFVPEERRGHGFAASMIERALRQANDNGYEAALLYSDIGPTLYERLGFVALASEEHEARVADLPASGAFETRPARDADEAAILAWGARRRDPRALRISRTPHLYRYFSWRGRIAGARVLVDRGRDVGYLIADRADGLRDLPSAPPETFFVDEWAAPEGTRDRALATIRALATDARCDRVLAWLASDEKRAPFVARARAEALPMIAPLASDLAVDPKHDFLDSFMHF